MPHQERGMPFGGRGVGGGMIRDGREPPHPMQVAEFQRRRMGRMIHPSQTSPMSPHSVMHARHGIPMSPHARYMGGPHHPESPSWYMHGGGSMRMVPTGMALAAASCESMAEEQRLIKRKELTATEETYEAPATEKAHYEQTPPHKHITDDDYSIGTSEADAASALLFATKAMKQQSCKVSVAESKADGLEHGEEDGDKEDSKEDETEQKDDSQTTTKTADNEEDEAEPNVPLKKRKLLDYLRRKPAETAHTNIPSMHVSPLPSPEVRNRVGVQMSSEDAGEVASPPKPSASSSMASIAHYYDLKEAQTIHDTAKISDAAEISPPLSSQVVIPHFPTVLHSILTKSDFAGSVMQWLDNGKAWKIMRWDALRRKVLPKFFPELRDEEGKCSGSIDAFLWHLRAWGFEEIKDGPDVGAYSHILFRKNVPDLCRQMTFTENPSNEIESPTPKKAISSPISEKLKVASQRASILQVPSLSSHPPTAESNVKPQEREMKHFSMRGSQSPNIAYPSMGAWQMHHPDAPVFVNYRTGDVAFAEGWQYYPDSPQGVRHLGPGIPRYESHSLAQRFHMGPRAVHQASPRLQSGRGALRLNIPVRATASREMDQAQTKSSFPVSNRGKGSRSPAFRTHLPSSELTEASGETAEKKAMEEQKVGEAVAERVVQAIAKKTKRKLPLSSKPPVAAAAAVKTEAEDEGDNVGEDEEQQQEVDKQHEEEAKEKQEENEEEEEEEEHPQGAVEV